MIRLIKDIVQLICGGPLYHIIFTRLRPDEPDNQVDVAF